MPTGHSGLVTKDGEPIRKGRISPALRTAIKLIVEDGLTIEDAAKRTGYKATSLSIALAKPHVRAFRADVKRAWLSSETERSWVTAAELMRHAASEDVRLKAARVFIDADIEASKANPERVGQLVQIVTQNVNLNGQLIGSQSPGVIEAPAYQPLITDPSNSDGVGWGESEADDEG